MNILGDAKDITEIIHNTWPVLLAFVGFGVWLIRLEGQVKLCKSAVKTPEQEKADLDEVEKMATLEASVKASKDAFEHYRKEQNEKQLAIWSKFDTFNTTLMNILQGVARLEGRLDATTKEKL